MELARPTFEKLCEVIQELCGLALGPEKAYLVRHRLTPLLHREGLESFERLVQRLGAGRSGRLHDAIIEAITTKETSFFRDKAYFDALYTEVLPDCVATLRGSRGRRHRVRVWSAGCSTGQEAYSVAMLIRELVDSGSADSAQERDFTVLATDLSPNALEYAKAGRYSDAEVARGVAPELLARFFTRRGAHWQVREPVRRLMQFRQLDLLRADASLGAFDLVLCRNVLIYFDEPTRARVMDGFVRLLQSGGWIMLGAAESLYQADPRLERVKFGRAVLYRKAGGV